MPTTRPSSAATSESMAFKPGSAASKVLVLGHAAYYPRFGFTPANTHGITSPWDVPDDVFMVLVLDQARMASVTGQAVYRPEFSTVACWPGQPRVSGSGSY